MKNGGNLNHEIREASKANCLFLMFQNQLGRYAEKKSHDLAQEFLPGQ